ncbi:MAG: LL-diaminopimelate aminotransferase [Bacteroidales bacterium]|nr:LL-diaminopimelate aminotransferase [Bacteroidales bacterium]MDY6406322.1 LL-diaminopimelate aminotransferase [Bacteroidales bacterium]
MFINTHLQQLRGHYLFTEIANRTKAYQQTHPEAHVLRLGIGDVTLPLPSVIIEAMHRAVDELASADTFRGYGPEEGYLWLRQAIVDNDYTPRGIHVSPEEVFISDGAGSDLGNLSELFDASNSVAILEPSYPAYVDTSRMAGREIIWLPCLAQNNFYPALPKQKADIIYLCFPNNPTGTVLTRDELSRWVEYARANHSIILFDAAYEAFIEDPDVPHSIYEIEGTHEVAIEIRSFSKTAGFTAVRCGYTVVPKATGLQTMWLRRQCTKFNGASYISQRAAEATYTPEGKAAIQANLSYYKQTAQIFLEGLRTLGYEVFGGKNAPYIWCRVPHGYTSWSFFDHLLHTSQIVCTPGAGFGPTGEGFVRFSAFSNRKDVEEALKRMKKLA